MFKNVDIITYLREQLFIEPIPTSNSLSDEYSFYSVESPINYSLSTDIYFHSEFNPSTTQWWKVNLLKIMYISSYKLLALDHCNWVNQWTIEFSLDDNNWNKVHEHNGFSENKKYSLKVAQPAQYVKISGSTNGCKIPKALAFQKIYLFGNVLKTLKSCHHSFHLLSLALIFLII